MRTSVFSRSPSRSVLSRVLPLSGALLAAALLPGCSSFSSLKPSEPLTLKRFIAIITPYKPDIIQGNVVTTEQISQVKTGMARTQVRDILGTPLITDPFHADRWDYVFTLKRQGYDDQQRKFSVLFEKDKVQKIDAPELPSEDQFVASISRKKLPDVTPKLELTDAERAALPAPVPVAAAASEAAPAGPTRSYPPLEPVAQ